MKKRHLFSAILASFLAIGLFKSWSLSQPIFDHQLDTTEIMNVEIAPIAEALTFARLENGDVLLAVDANNDGVLAINVSSTTGKSFSDAIEAFHTIGKNALRELSAQSVPNSYAWGELDIPIVSQYPHVAVGTNYYAHAQEVGHKGDPFLFPKLSHATRWDADVTSGSRMDHEVELCAVPINDHSTDSPSTLAYILCGDFTDRWTLIKTMDIGGTMGLTGFPTGKGGKSRLPVGSLLIIPESPDFYQKIDLSLYVNESMRQHSLVGKLIWSPKKILSEILSDCSQRYIKGNSKLSVSDCKKIPSGTLILTGTPAGVMFQPATLWNPTAYLQVGDIVTSSATYLGFMHNTMVAK